MDDRSYKSQGTKNGNNLKEPVDIYLKSDAYVTSYKTALAAQITSLNAKIVKTKDKIAEINAKHKMSTPGKKNSKSTRN